MCVAGRVLSLSALALLFAGCDTEQPAGGGEATASIEYHVEASGVATAVVYPNLRVDTNGDEIPDAVISAKNEFNAPPVCETDPFDTVTVPLPWGIGLEVSVVRAGTTVPVVIQSTEGPTGAFEFSVVSQYDATGTPLPDRPIVPPRDVSGARKAYFYTDGTQTHRASAVYLETCASIEDLPEYQPTTFSIARGDLVRVMARRVEDPPNNPLELVFAIPLLVNGVPVAVDGTISVTSPENGIAFTYVHN